MTSNYWNNESSATYGIDASSVNDGIDDTQPSQYHSQSIVQA